jgi:hypothetical protein
MLPESASWTHRFNYHSDSGSEYTIAQNKASRGWGCSCPRWRFKRGCKHLDSLGLPHNLAPCEVEIQIIGSDSPRTAAHAMWPQGKPVADPLAARLHADSVRRTAPIPATLGRPVPAFRPPPTGNPADIVRAANAARMVPPPASTPAPEQPVPGKRPKRAYNFDD